MQVGAQCTDHVKEPLPTTLTQGVGAEHKGQPLLSDWGSLTTKQLGAKVAHEI